MSSDACARFINKFKSLVVTDLVAADHTELTQLQPKVNFLVDFVANIVDSFFNVEDLAALLTFIGNYMVIFKLPVLKAVEELYHEFIVNIVIESVKWKLEIYILTKSISSILKFPNLVIDHSCLMTIDIGIGALIYLL